MPEQRTFSTAAVADALGVGVTTVKRWVDDGLLPAYRTAGGHRKILAADVLRLTNRVHLPRADLSLFTAVPPRAGRPTPDDLGARLFDALRTADADGARTLLTRAYLAGWPVERLADEAVGPALTRVGDEWASGRMDVYEEHRIGQLCLAALHDLRGRLAPTAGRDRPLAVGGCPEGDPTQTATFLAQMTLEEAGWRAVNVGPNTPAESFWKAIRDLRPKLLWVSCTHLSEPERFLAEYPAVWAEAEKAGTAVAVGGRALTEAVRSRLRYTAFGDGMTQLAMLARTLHPRPRAGGAAGRPDEVGAFACNSLASRCWKSITIGASLSFHPRTRRRRGPPSAFVGRPVPP